MPRAFGYLGAAHGVFRAQILEPHGLGANPRSPAYCLGASYLTLPCVSFLGCIMRSIIYLFHRIAMRINEMIFISK